MSSYVIGGQSPTSYYHSRPMVRCRGSFDLRTTPLPPLGVDGPRYPRISIEGPPGPKLCLGYVDTSRDSLGHVGKFRHILEVQQYLEGNRVYLRPDAITVCCGKRPQYLEVTEYICGQMPSQFVVARDHSI